MPSFAVLHSLSRRALFPTVSALFVILVCALVRVKNGQVIYPLDDTYIHLALGRTLATTGVWGVQPTDWAAASSSPLYTLLIAGLYLLWPLGLISFTFAPLLINLLAGIWLIHILRHSVAAVILLMLGVPLVALTLLGMEHLLHIVLAVLLVREAMVALSQDRPRYTVLVLLTVLAVSCRYESLILVAILTVFAVVRRRWRLVAMFPIMAALPVIGFGTLWVSHGGWFEPNSLLLKAPVPHGSFGSIVRTMLWKMRWNFDGKTLVSALTLSVATGLTALLTLQAGVRFVRRQASRKSEGAALGVLVIGASVTQFVCGSVGWLYRYEAWLLMLNVLACLTLAPRLPTALILAGILLPRGYMDTRDTLLAPQDRLNEHFTPAAFIAQYYSGQTVALNDLGVAAWTSHATLLDIFGLGSNEPVAMRKARHYTPDAVAAWTAGRGVKLAILQECWFVVAPITPASWELVEAWQIPRNTVFPDHTVAFYAPTQDTAAMLRRDLAAFVAPSGIRRTMVSAGADKAAKQAALRCDPSTIQSIAEPASPAVTAAAAP